MTLRCLLVVLVWSSWSAPCGAVEEPAASATAKEANRVIEAGKSLLGFLKSYAKSLKERDLDTLMSLYDQRYFSKQEGRWTETLESDRDGLQVFRWKIDRPRTLGRSSVRSQAADLLGQLKLIDSVEFKLSSIEELDRDGSAMIVAVLWLKGTGTSQLSHESQAKFRVWLSSAGSDWKIKRKELLSGWTVKGSRAAFTDITKSAGIDFEARHSPLWNTVTWQPKKYGLVKYASSGVAAADYDNDGWCDIFFCDGRSPRLFRNQRNGSFKDVTAEVGLPLAMAAANVAIFADFDNDGDKELFVAGLTGRSLLFRNDGGSFTDVSAAVEGAPWVATAAVADYDNDGLLDIYVGRYLDATKDLPSLVFYTRNSAGNTLLRNQGNLRFRDVTKQAGVRDGGLTLGVGWGDYDRDGDQDLYVANDFGRNALFRNNGNGRFTDVSQSSGTIDIRYGMSVTFADFDNDLDLDLYVSNVHSGQRWYGHPAILQQYLINASKRVHDIPLLLEVYSAIGGRWKAFGENINRGNSLYLNRGDGRFADVSNSARVTPYGWYWGSTALDFDNDGRQDIYAANGWVTSKQTDDL